MTYPLPIYETASWAGTYTMLACLHCFRNGNGETLAERNFDRLNIPVPLRKFTRWLAIMGICQIGMPFTYNIPPCRAAIAPYWCASKVAFLKKSSAKNF
jgi:hypothetical protein